MKHDHIVERLSDYRDLALSAADRETVSRHLTECTDCAMVLSDWELLSKAFLRRSPAPTSFQTEAFIARVTARLPGAEPASFAWLTGRWFVPALGLSFTVLALSFRPYAGPDVSDPAAALLMGADRGTSPRDLSARICWSGRPRVRRRGPMKPGCFPTVPAFLLGLALGAAAGSWGQRVAFHRAMRTDPNHHRIMLEKMSRELGLNDQQKNSVSAVMDSKKADVDRLKTETFARLEMIRKAADAEMLKTLTPEQAAKLEAMHRRAKPMRISWEAPSSPPSPAP